VATKGGFRRQGAHEWSADCRPDALHAACEGSLRRLVLDGIGLYQLHVVDAAVPIEESVGTLSELQSEGKVVALGVCNVDLEQLARARSTAEIVSVQNRLSLAELAALDRERLWSYCANRVARRARIHAVRARGALRGRAR